MRIYGQRSSSLQTFSGAHADLRFGRDDVSGDFILRERDLHSNVAHPMRLTNDDDPMETLPTEDGDDDREDGRDDFFPRPKALHFGY